MMVAKGSSKGSVELAATRRAAASSTAVIVTGMLGQLETVSSVCARSENLQSPHGNDGHCYLTGTPVAPYGSTMTSTPIPNRGNGVRPAYYPDGEGGLVIAGRCGYATGYPNPGIARQVEQGPK